MNDLEKLTLQTADAVVTTHERLQRQAQRIDKIEDLANERIRAAELASRLETWAARKLSPRTRRSEKLAALDDRVAELEARRHDVLEEINAFRGRIPEAETEHQAALTLWHKEREGARPESPVQALEARLSALQEDYTALDALIGEALADKAAWVERHRDALVRDARTAVEEAAARYRDAIDTLVEAREGLLAARRDEVWTLLYPSATVQSEPPTAMLAGGIISRLRSAVPGINMSLGVPELRRLLEADADFAATAMTPDQKQELAARESPTSATSVASVAIWTQTQEGQDALRHDREEARERYRREWGVYPS